MKRTTKLLFSAAALLLLAQALYARRPEVRHEDIFIATGETVKGDVATDMTLTIDGTLDGSATSVGGATVTVSGRLTGDLVSMGGPVFIPGLVDGDVSSIGGPVDVSGRVSGNVSAVGGKVLITGQGQIDGDISALGGGVEKGEDARHRGSVNSFNSRALRSTIGNAMRTVRFSVRYGGERHGPREERRGGPWLIVLLSMLGTGLLVLMITVIFFSKNVENSAAAIKGDIWRSCGIGALAVVAFFPVLLMMAVSILGIPLIPFALILFAVAAVLGLGAFSVLLQERFFQGIKRKGPSGLAGKVATGYGLMAGLLLFGKLIPVLGGLLALIGLMLLAFGTMVGLGGAWATRMGSRPVLPAAPMAVPPVQDGPPPASPPPSPQEPPPADPPPAQ